MCSHASVPLLQGPHILLRSTVCGHPIGWHPFSGCSDGTICPSAPHEHVADICVDHNPGTNLAWSAFLAGRQGGTKLEIMRRRAKRATETPNPGSVELLRVEGPFKFFWGRRALPNRIHHGFHWRGRRALPSGRCSRVVNTPSNPPCSAASPGTGSCPEEVHVHVHHRAQ